MRLSSGMNRFQPRLWLALLIVGMGYVPAANAQKGHAAPHASAPHASAAHVSAPHYSAPRMPQAPRAPSMPKQMNWQPNYAAANRARSAVASHAATSKANRAANVSSNTASNSTVRASNNAAHIAAARARAVSAQNTYYGRARRYGGYNYRPRYYASGRRYTGSSTSRADRMVISRLRSAHANLARLDHDYQGHRVQAMHHISMAIRQLSHRSMMSQGNGFSARMTGMQRNGNVNGNRNGNGMRLSQAQSDSRLRHSLLMVTGAGQMLSQQSNATNASYVSSGANTGRYRAYGYIHMAANELNTALTVR
jgi:hypothetical protein